MKEPAVGYGVNDARQGHGSLELFVGLAAQHKGGHFGGLFRLLRCSVAQELGKCILYKFFR
jgi:hypothetical protein